MPIAITIAPITKQLLPSTVQKPCLLVPAEDIPDGRTSSEGLVDLHGASSRVSKYCLHTLSFKGLHQDVCPLPGFVPVSVLPLLGPIALHITLKRRLSCSSCLIELQKAEQSS